MFKTASFLLTVFTAPALMALAAAQGQSDNTCTDAFAPGNLGPGSGECCGARSVNPDFYEFVLAPGDSMTFEALFTHTPQVNIDLALYDECPGPPIAVRESTTDDELITYTNETLVTKTAIVEVYNAAGSGQSCDASYFAVTRASRQGPCGGDDHLEPNGRCNATPLTEGTVNGLSIQPDSEDSFRVEIPPGETMEFSLLTYLESVLFIEFYDENCNYLGFHGNSTLPQGLLQRVSATRSNPSALPEVLIVNVLNVDDDTECQNYSIHLSIGCGPNSDDGFEPNDSCGSAAALPLGETTGLIAADDDYWSTTIVPDNELLVAVDFNVLYQDLVVELYDASSMDCGSPQSAGLLATGLLTANGAILQWKNNTAFVTDAVVAIRPVAGGSPCVEYGMVAGISDENSLGGTVCEGVPNSTGVGAELVVQGAAVVAINDVRLGCEDLPPNSFGYFITSRGYGFVQGPAGSFGNLCIVSSPLGRYARPNQIQDSGANGSVLLPIDLTDTPTSSGPVAVIEGETRYFQYWFRDFDSGSGTVGSNFSSAVFVNFR